MLGIINKNLIGHYFRQIWNILVKYAGILNLAVPRPICKPNRPIYSILGSTVSYKGPVKLAQRVKITH